MPTERDCKAGYLVCRTEALVGAPGGCVPHPGEPSDACQHPYQDHCLRVHHEDVNRGVDQADALCPRSAVRVELQAEQYLAVMTNDHHQQEGDGHQETTQALALGSCVRPKHHGGNGQFTGQGKLVDVIAKLPEGPHSHSYVRHLSSSFFPPVLYKKAPLYHKISDKSSFVAGAVFLRRIALGY